MVHVLVADLDKNTAGFGQQFAGEQEPVAQVGEVGVNAEFPRIAERAYLFRLGGQVVVLAVLHVAFVDERLEVGAVFDPIGRVHVDHLHLARHAFFFQQAVHHKERIARHKTVRPAVRVLVELDGVAQRLGALDVEQRGLRRVAIALLHGFDDRARVNAFVHVQAYRRHLERGVLRLARPHKLGIEMRVILVGPLLSGVWVCFRGDKAYGRVVRSLFVGVVVGFNRTGTGGLLPCHQGSPRWCVFHTVR